MDKMENVMDTGVNYVGVYIQPEGGGRREACFITNHWPFKIFPEVQYDLYTPPSPPPHQKNAYNRYQIIVCYTAPNHIAVRRSYGILYRPKPCSE